MSNCQCCIFISLGPPPTLSRARSFIDGDHSIGIWIDVNRLIEWRYVNWKFFFNFIFRLSSGRRIFASRFFATEEPVPDRSEELTDAIGQTWLVGSILNLVGFRHVSKLFHQLCLNQLFPDPLKLDNVMIGKL